MRRAVILGLTVLLVAACSVRSDRVTPIISIPTDPISDAQNVGSGECLLTVGPGIGVKVQTVDDAGPSAGVIDVGDVITSLGGDPTPDAYTLVALVRSHQVGETVPVVVTRGGETLDLEVVLAENPDAAGTARMGIEGAPLSSQSRISDLPLVDDSFRGQFTWVVEFGSDFLVFDPVDVRWARLGLSATSDANFTVIGENVYLIVRDSTTFVVTATDVATGNARTLSTGDWQPVSLLPPLDGRFVFGASRQSATASQGVETAVIGVDAATGQIAWTVTIDDDPSGSILPSLGYQDPYATRLAVDLTPLDGVTPTSTFGHLLIEPTEAGGVLATATVGIPDTALPRGWSGENRLMWSVNGTVYLTDPSNGLTRTVALATGDTLPTSFWPVGDGSAVIAVGATSMQLTDVDGPGARPIAESCPTPRLFGPGWGV